MSQIGMPLELEKQTNGSSVLVVPAGTHVLMDLHLPAMNGQKINQYTLIMDVNLDLSSLRREKEKETENKDESGKEKKSDKKGEGNEGNEGKKESKVEQEGGESEAAPASENELEDLGILSTSSVLELVFVS